MLIFSYGSGLSATMFAVELTPDIKKLQLDNVRSQLENRQVCTPTYFEHALELREQTAYCKDYTPTGDISHIRDGTYILTHVDEKYKRYYRQISKPNL